MSLRHNFQVFETQARYASDLVHWVEGSGPVFDQPRPLAHALENTLEINLLDAPLKIDPESILLTDRTPSDLTLTHKTGVMILWRLNANDSKTLISAHAKNSSADARTRPLETAYKVSGTISDQQKRVNPREFNLVDVGNFIDVSDPLAKGHEVKLYRSPMGTQMGSLGGVQGRIQWDTGEIASWAIITCEVTLKHTTGTHSYSAQADINGDFRLAFASLPFPKKEDDSRPPYACTLTVSALKSASQQKWHQPDDFVTAELKELVGDDEEGEDEDEDEFSESIDFDFFTGKIQRLKSMGSDAFLIIKETE